MKYLSLVLLINGVADLMAAFMLIVFPAFGIKVPGHGLFSYETAFACGGWGAAAMTFGIARIWASRNEKYRRYMAYLSLFEGWVLFGFCILSIILSPVTVIQALFPLVIGGGMALAYSVAIISMIRGA